MGRDLAKWREKVKSAESFAALTPCLASLANSLHDPPRLSYVVHMLEKELYERYEIVWPDQLTYEIVTMAFPEVHELEILFLGSLPPETDRKNEGKLDFGVMSRLA